jgi:hypothetical protein
MSTSKNDITGDTIASKTTTDSFREGYDRIFGKKEQSAELEEAVNETTLPKNWPFPVVNGEPR